MMATKTDDFKVETFTDEKDGLIQGDEARFIDHLTGIKSSNDGDNFTKHEGLEDHCFFAIMRHA